uniref:Uncharacterized protein n=1 Tax=Cannabis sativa TaxID=3483 RepID=A0A803NMW2_CANSA
MDFVAGDDSSEDMRGSNPGDNPDPTFIVQARRRLFHHPLHKACRRPAQSPSPSPAQSPSLSPVQSPSPSPA